MTCKSVQIWIHFEYILLIDSRLSINRPLLMLMIRRLLSSFQSLIIWSLDCGKGCLAKKRSAKLFLYFYIFCSPSVFRFGYSTKRENSLTSNINIHTDITMAGVKEPLVTTLYPSCSRLLRMETLEAFTSSLRLSLFSSSSGHVQCFSPDRRKCDCSLKERVKKI